MEHGLHHVIFLLRPGGPGARQSENEVQQWRAGVGIDDLNGDDSAQAPAQAGAQSKCALIEKLRAKLQIVGAGGDGVAAIAALDRWRRPWGRPQRP